MLITTLISALLGGPTAFAADKMELNLANGSGAVEFRAIGHPSALKIVGHGERATGTYVVNQNEVSGTAVFRLDTLDTDNNTRNKHMKETYLEVAKYPEAKLVLSPLKLKGPLAEGFQSDRQPFQGKLTLHGVEKPVSGRVNISRDKKTVTLVADFEIKLRDFNISIPSFLNITVADEVQINVKNTVPAP